MEKICRAVSNVCFPLLVLKKENAEEQMEGKLGKITEETNIHTQREKAGVEKANARERDHVCARQKMKDFPQIENIQPWGVLAGW